MALNPVDAAIEDALLHHAAELVLMGNAPMSELEEILFSVGFQQGVQWALTGDWRLGDG